MAVKPVLDWLSGAWRPAPSGRSPLSPPWRWPSSQGWIGNPALGGQSRQMFPERLPGTSQTSPLGLGESLAVGPGLDSLSGARRPAPSRRGKGITALRCHFGLSARPASASSPAHPFALAAGYSVNQASPRQNAVWALAKKMRTAGRAGG